MQRWCKEKEIELKFIQKGKPSQNGYIERFNRTFREDVLDRFAFDSSEQASDICLCMDVFDTTMKGRTAHWDGTSSPIDFMQERLRGLRHYPHSCMIRISRGNL